MKLKFICCDVLSREAEYCIDKSDNDIDIVYTKKSSHEKPDELKAIIQKFIDESQDYDAILIGFGLCGNSIAGLKSKDTKLIIPRAHDCCTLFLGSRSRYNELFKDNPSMPWGCTGYCEKDGDYLKTSDTGQITGLYKEYEEFVEQYGEENAQFIWQSLHPETNLKEVLFINIPETFSQEVFNDFKSSMDKEGKEIIETKGSMTIVEKLVNGEWDDDFIIIEQNHKVKPVYDNKLIITSSQLQ